MIQDAECIFQLDGRYKSEQPLQFWQVEQCAHNCIDVIITPTSINTIPIRVTGAHPWNQLGKYMKAKKQMGRFGRDSPVLAE